MDAEEGISTCVLHYRKDGSSFWNFVSLQPVVLLLNPERYTLNPKPQTLNPKPYGSSFWNVVCLQPVVRFASGAWCLGLGA